MRRKLDLCHWPNQRQAHRLNSAGFDSHRTAKRGLVGSCRAGQSYGDARSGPQQRFPAGRRLHSLRQPLRTSVPFSGKFISASCAPFPPKCSQSLVVPDATSDSPQTDETGERRWHDTGRRLRHEPLKDYSPCRAPRGGSSAPDGRRSRGLSYGSRPLSSAPSGAPAVARALLDCVTPVRRLREQRHRSYASSIE